MEHEIKKKLARYYTQSSNPKGVRHFGEVNDNAGVRKVFYSGASEYWQGIEPTVNGMLGGLEEVSPKDVECNEMFLKTVKDLGWLSHRVRAADCGGGIGRVTKTFLSRHFDQVDLVDECQEFTSKTRYPCEQRMAFFRLACMATLSLVSLWGGLLLPVPTAVPSIVRAYVNSDKLDNVWCMGLQEFSPPSDTYDVVWCQWVLGHLSDYDLVAFLRRVKASLCKNERSMIVVKENTSIVLVEDHQDHSVTRVAEHMLDIFTLAGLRVVQTMMQEGFPAHLYPVQMWGLVPMDR